LKFRGKKSLGWIPTSGASIKLFDGGFRFMKKNFQVWDSYGLGNFKAKDCNISQDSRGRWYLCVPVEFPDLTLPENPKAVGIDLGLKDSAVTSEGQKLTAKWYHRIQKQLAGAQRAKKKNRTQALHAKAKNQRLDAIHKFTTQLVRIYGSIFVGDVSSEFLIKFSSKSALDAGHGILRNQLRYKSQQAGRNYLRVSESFTTQTCSACGSKAGPKGYAGLNERLWICNGCGASHDRDINSAINIRNLGLGHRPLVEGNPL
jgi:transposase